MANVLKTDLLEAKKGKYEADELISSNFNFSYNEALENLKTDTLDDFTKVFSIVSINELKTFEDTLILFNHLTNKPNPIREAAAYKIEDLAKNHINFYINESLKETFLKAIVDINPNVSRAICNIFYLSSDFKHFLEKDIILNINQLLSDIKEIENNEKDNKKSHAKNKKMFALYWLMEALSICLTNENNSKVLEILNSTINFSDYTIREKTAKILINIEPKPIELLQKAKQDVNFYVKNIVYDKINFED